jgi:glucan phosphoethanolaminetransferase (alkaline phosphatase superfamily)
MKTKMEQLVWLVIATLFTGGIIFFVTDSIVVTAIAMAFTGIVGAFLGIDIATMIAKTKSLPPGEYKEINKHRYIVSMVIFALLLLEAFFISGHFKRDCNTLFASFGVGFLIVIGGLVAGVEGNKIVTEQKE